MHLLRKVRERALNGYFINIFDLLRPEGESGVTGTKQDKKERAKGGAERTFHNWMAGYTVYVTLVSAAFPERAWHLMNHLSNVLKARVLAGDCLAMDYDEAFRQRASHNELARWDLRNNDIWLEVVGPHARVRGDIDKKKLGWKRDASKRLCWEFNQARCHCTRCKYEHLCEACFGHHARVACNRVSGAQMPFRGGRPSGSSGGQRDGSGHGAAEPAATNNKRA